MPRNTINIPDKVEYLSILNEKGELDASLEPDIPEETSSSNYIGPYF